MWREPFQIGVKGKASHRRREAKNERASSEGEGRGCLDRRGSESEGRVEKKPGGDLLAS